MHFIIFWGNLFISSKSKKLTLNMHGVMREHCKIMQLCAVCMTDAECVWNSILIFIKLLDEMFHSYPFVKSLIYLNCKF